MTQSPEFFAQFEAVARRLVPDARLLSLRRLEGGISAETHHLTYRSQTTIHQAVIRRLARHGNAARTEQEFALLQQLHKQGINVPKPFFCDGSLQIFPEPYFVMAYVPGEILLSPSNRASYITQLAQQLAAIHQIVLPADCAPAVPAANGELGYDGAVYPFGVATVARNVVATYSLQQHNRPRLLHGDFWPGNALWRDGKLIAVIDWEDAMYGDPLVDLAIARLDIAMLFGVEALELFTRSYQDAAKIDLADLAYWDLCAGLRIGRIIGSDLTDWLRQFPSLGRPDISEQSLESGYNYVINRALTRLS